MENLNAIREELKRIQNRGESKFNPQLDLRKIYPHITALEEDPNTRKNENLGRLHNIIDEIRYGQSYDLKEDIDYALELIDNISKSLSIHQAKAANTKNHIEKTENYKQINSKIGSWQKLLNKIDNMKKPTAKEIQEIQDKFKEFDAKDFKENYIWFNESCSILKNELGKPSKKHESIIKEEINELKDILKKTIEKNSPNQNMEHDNFKKVEQSKQLD